MSGPRLRGRYVFKRVSEHPKTRVDFRIGLEHLKPRSGALLDAEADYSEGGVRFQAGDVILGTLNPHLAKVWHADRQGDAVGCMLVFRPTERMSPEFLKYFFLSRHFLDRAQGAAYGVTRPTVSWEFVADFLVPVPPLSQQHEVTHCLSTKLPLIAAITDSHAPRLSGLFKEAALPDLANRAEKLSMLFKEYHDSLITENVITC